ncbi:DUF2808 domain-containing protein [Argonema galeatum]|uniref:DUF2808 domain-containing protein n=1 Tax=Argonema galeatum TaxID=2942762 RepID=UPI002012C64C|nr:DUF2808 domain-containing protein [Argonema galeatum]MCL1468483.1 DUF2808 domain-containing protein [Argonema galeatum A003/A1]
MRISTWLAATVAISTGLLSGAEVASAVRLADGTVYFAQPPSLVSATTTFNDVYMWGSTYYFTLNVPPNAGEPLERVAIAQQEGIDDIEFELEDSRAFEGTRRDKGQRIALEAMEGDNKRSLSFTFDPPVPPGKTVTIALNPVRNPRYAGVYLFGVTAFPAGEKTHGQFLGFGRLHFYENRNFGWH